MCAAEPMWHGGRIAERSHGACGMCAAEPIWHGSRIAERSHRAQRNVRRGASTLQNCDCDSTDLSTAKYRVKWAKRDPNDWAESADRVIPREC
jgi:hypothetical protein